MRSTKKITLSAILSAMTVALLCIGSLLDVLDLTSAALASFLVFFAELELRGPYPLLIWICSSLLAFLLAPSGTAVLLYALFAGVYPVCKLRFEQLPRVFAWVAKFALFAACFFVIWLISAFVLMLPSEFTFGSWLFWALLLLAIMAFILYDILLSRLVGFYVYRLRPRIARLLR